MNVDDGDPLAAFFGLYSPFRYNRACPSHDEYRRLCAFFGWPTRRLQEHHTERDEAWDGFRIAMVKAFNRTFGHDENDIEAWGRMCVLVGAEPVHDTLEARREVRKLFSLRPHQQMILYLSHLYPLLFGSCITKRTEI